MMWKDPALDGKKRAGDMPWRAGNDVPREAVLGKGTIPGQRMSGQTDAGNRGRGKLFEIQRGFLLPFFYAESRVHFLVFHHPQKGGKRNHADGGAKQRKFLTKFMKNGRKEIQLQMVVAAYLKGNQVFMLSQPLLGGIGSL